jgi:hypothetical protein
MLRTFAKAPSGRSRDTRSKTGTIWAAGGTFMTGTIPRGSDPPGAVQVSAGVSEPLADRALNVYIADVIDRTTFPATNTKSSARWEYLSI